MKKDTKKCGKNKNLNIKQKHPSPPIHIRIIIHKGTQHHLRRLKKQNKKVESKIEKKEIFIHKRALRKA